MRKDEKRKAREAKKGEKEREKEKLLKKKLEGKVKIIHMKNM